MSNDRQRIDKWLWHARVVRTRGAAAALVTAGHVRLNGERVLVSSRPVRPGDVVTVALDRAVRTLKVAGFAERRGSADTAKTLYESILPDGANATPDPLPQGARERGAGRPSKQERRALDRLRSNTTRSQGTG